MLVPNAVCINHYCNIYAQYTGLIRSNTAVNFKRKQVQIEGGGGQFHIIGKANLQGEALRLYTQLCHWLFIIYLRDRKPVISEPLANRLMVHTDRGLFKQADRQPIVLPGSAPSESGAQAHARSRSSSSSASIGDSPCL